MVSHCVVDIHQMSLQDSIAVFNIPHVHLWFVVSGRVAILVAMILNLIGLTASIFWFMVVPAGLNHEMKTTAPKLRLPLELAMYKHDRTHHFLSCIYFSDVVLSQTFMSRSRIVHLKHYT
jgi:hypothetical protein